MDLWSCPDGDIGATIGRFWDKWPNVHRRALNSATLQAFADERSAENLSHELSPQLKNWMRVSDEVNGWLIALYLEMRFADDEELERGDQRSTPQFRAALFLLGRVVSDGQAIKVLTLHGCECQSRILLRSTIEHLDLLGATIEDAQLATEFLKSGSEDASNQFWHKFISRGKLKKNPLSLMRDFPELKEWWTDFRKSEDDMHSIFSHPNIAAAAVLNYLQDEKCIDPHLVYVRKASSVSIRTIRFFVFHIMHIAWSGETNLLSVTKNLEGHFSILGTPIRKEIGEAIHIGRLVLVGLFVFLIGNLSETFLEIEIDDEEK